MAYQRRSALYAFSRERNSTSKANSHHISSPLLAVSERGRRRGGGIELRRLKKRENEEA